MDSNIQEEVKKRRSMPSAVNIYQRLVLLAGAGVLTFAVWTTPASMPAVGVIGTTLLIFFVLKDSKETQDRAKRIDPKETLPEAGQNVDLQEILPRAGENVGLREMLSEAGEDVNPQEMLPEVGKNVDLQEMLSEPEEKKRAEKAV